MGSHKERPLFRSAMFVAIENDKGEYLLQRRMGTGFLDGYYDLASGHLEYGESCETCAVRETKEEYGVDVAEEDLELVATFQSEFEDDIRYLNLVYRTNRFDGEPIIGEPEKIDDMQWFKPEEFPEKLTVGARVFLEAVKDGAVRNYYVDNEAYGELMGEAFTQKS
jgi:8-oxo-dGTP pyrophosphatase MutT (NUDIX family)